MNFFEGIPDACSDKDLDEKIWQVARTKKGGSEKKYYFNKLTRTSFWTLPPLAYGRYLDADVIFLSLVLAFNKRELKQFDFKGRTE